ncbi:MAG: hypothetical protein H0T79_12590 [Deltaproteobacteria bacterium]|nr:hypothetical protein [Deltaproteobacteria bacterium]
MGSTAWADTPIATAAPTQITPDPPASTSRTLAPASFPPSWDLDGFHIWLGPIAAASHAAATWDSTFGADLTILRVRERATVGVLGGSLGASRWTERGGGRIWLDAVVGTRIAGWMAGATAGPILELSDFEHPRVGGSVGLWAFVGITPFVRAGVVGELGGFVELGVHLALPVWRR